MYVTNNFEIQNVQRTKKPDYFFNFDKGFAFLLDLNFVMFFPGEPLIIILFSFKEVSIYKQQYF